MKNKKGITIIALVITIIIMVILAAVVVTFSIGENGIITRARKASQDSKVVEAVEEINQIAGEVKSKADIDDEQYTYEKFIEAVRQKTGNKYQIANLPYGSGNKITMGDTDILLERIYSGEENATIDKSKLGGGQMLPSGLEAPFTPRIENPENALILKIEKMFDTSRASSFIDLDIEFKEGVEEYKQNQIYNDFKIALSYYNDGNPVWDPELTLGSGLALLYEPSGYNMGIASGEYFFAKIRYVGNDSDKIQQIRISARDYTIGDHYRNPHFIHHIVDFGNLGSKFLVEIYEVGEVYNPFKVLGVDRGTGYKLEKRQVGGDRTQFDYYYTPYLFQNLPELEKIEFVVYMKNMHENLFAANQNLKSIEGIAARYSDIPQNIFKHNKNLDTINQIIAQNVGLINENRLLEHTKANNNLEYLRKIEFEENEGDQWNYEYLGDEE